MYTYATDDINGAKRATSSLETLSAAGGCPVLDAIGHIRLAVARSSVSQKTRPAILQQEPEPAPRIGRV